MSLQQRIATLAWLGFALTLAGQDLRELSFMTAMPARPAPVIDGRLTDPCWQTAVPNLNYYEFLKPNPKRVNTPRTECSVVYDDAGLAIGVVNHDDQIGKLKQAITKNHHGSTWTDDCGEFYIDPDAQGIGFYKFVVNSLGKFDDLWRMDRANTFADWNSAGVRSAAWVGTNRWELEIFIPWSDMGRRQPARPGDLWMFNHSRFCMGRGWGNFSTSAPGGSYYSPEKFGYLHFSSGTAPDMRRIAQIIAARLNSKWGIEIGDTVVLNTDDGVRFTRLEEFRRETEAGLAQLATNCVEQLREVNRPDLNRRLGQSLQALDKAGAACDGSFAGIKSLADQRAGLEWVLWNGRAEQLLTTADAMPAAAFGPYRLHRPAKGFDGYNGYYLTHVLGTYETPHLDWGKRLRDPLDILFSAPTYGARLRYGAEIFQRFGYGGECFTTFGNDAFGGYGHYDDPVSGNTPPDKDAQFIDLLKRRPDVFFFWGFNFNAMRGDFRYEILRRVRDEGAGLVLLGTPGHREIIDKLPRLDAVAEAVCALAPYPQLPGAYPDRAPEVPPPAATNILDVRALGHGRILYLPAMPDLGWTPEWKALFECRNAFYGRVVAAAGQRGGGVLACGPVGTVPFGTESAAVQARFPMRAPLRARLGLGAAPYALRWRIRSEQNAVVARGETAGNQERFGLRIPLRLQPGAEGPAAAVAAATPLPAGRYYLDLVASVAGEAVDHGFVPFTVASPVGALSLKAPDSARDRAPISWEAAWEKGLPRAATLELTLSDLPYRRLWWRARLPVRAGARALSGIVTNYPLPTRSGLLEACLIADGVEQVNTRQIVFFPDADFPVYGQVAWQWLGDAGLAELHAPQAVERFGWTGNLSENGPQSAYFNARALTYVAHLRTGRSKSGGIEGVVGYHVIRDSKKTAEVEQALDGDQNPYRPEVRQVIADAAAAQIPVMARYAPIAYNLGDECGFSINACFGPSDVKFFAEFLEGKYKTIENYNALAGTKYASFAEVPHKEPAKAFAEGDYQSWFDQVQYTERVYADTFHIFAEEIGKWDPGARVGAEGSPGGDLEYTVSKLKFWGPYGSKMQNEVLREIAPPGLLRGCWWGGYLSEARDGYIDRLWRFLVTGAANTDLWYTLEPGSTMGAFNGAFEAAPYVVRILPHLNALRWGSGQQLVVTPMLRQGLALWYSHESNRASEIDERMVQPGESQNALIDFCYRHGLGLEIITKNRLDRLAAAKVVFLFGANALTDAEIEALKVFVDGGGLVVADMPPAFMNAYMIANKQNPLAGLFGETTLATCGEAHMAPLRLDGEYPLAAAAVKTIKGIPQVNARTVGKGETVLLNFTLSTAWDTAADPAAFDRFLLALLARRGIAPQVEVRATTADRALVRIRCGSGFDLVSMLVPVEAVGQPLTLDLRGRARHIYRVDEGYCGYADRIRLRKLDMPWVQFALFDTPQAAPQLELSATRLALGGAVQLDLRPLRENGVYLLDVRGPRDFREVIHCDGKRTNHDIRLALNDKPGTYVVTLKDMATALTRETCIEAVANP